MQNKPITQTKNNLLSRILLFLTIVYLSLISINAKASYNPYDDPCKTDGTLDGNKSFSDCELKSCMNGEDVYKS
jgi:hypothetical protein